MYDCPATAAATSVEASATKLAQMLEKVAQRTADCRSAVQRMAADLVAEQAIVEGSLSSSLDGLAVARSSGRALARIPLALGPSSSKRPSTRAGRAERFARVKVSASVAVSQAPLRALHDVMDAQHDRFTAISYVAVQRAAELEQSCTYAEDNVAALTAVQMLIANIGTTNRGKSSSPVKRAGKHSSGAGKLRSKPKSKQPQPQPQPKEGRGTSADVQPNAPAPPMTGDTTMPPRPAPPRTRAQRTAASGVTIG